MITYTFKRKLFGLNEKGEVITMDQRRDELRKKFGVKEGQSLTQALGKKAGENGGVTYNKKTKTAIQDTKNQVYQQNTQQIAQKAQQRNITQSAPVKAATNKAFQAGQKQGQNSVGIMGGIKNTWNNSGTLGKAGMVAAGVGTAALAAKGIASMFGSGRKRKRRKYEDDY